MTPSLRILPEDGLVDRERHIRLEGFGPGDVVLRTSLEHPDGSSWSSEARFRVADDGTVDLRRDAPVSGDWRDVSPMGPVLFMQRRSAPRDPLLSEGVEPLRHRLIATGADGRVAEAALIQGFVAAGVGRRDIDEAGLTATLFIPAGPGPHPAVVVLNGSGGGVPERRAALYAAHGYAALALGYFKAPGRPEWIADTPLEYFESALEWIATTLAPRNGFIAVSGHSRGGELSLLLGSRFTERVSAVIGYVPSDLVHGTLRAGAPHQPRDATVWTWRGQGLSNAWRDNPAADWWSFDHPPSADEPIRQAPAFDSIERHSSSVAAARIAVERIRGPVMLISGGDDGFWPSRRYCRRILDALSRHPWPVEHYGHPEAGHAIGLPWLPTTELARPHPVAGVTLSGGGTAPANAEANDESWQRVLGFLAAAVGAREGGR